MAQEIADETMRTPGTGSSTMAEEIPQPHDSMVRAVLGDVAEARSFLQRYVPEELSQTLNWSTLRRLEGSFVDEELRRSETDVLYEVERVEGESSLWLYVLLEHQSTPDRWMRFRLLKYCCRIWDMNLAARPAPSELRPIVPLVFYQGERSWSYSTEFADLFAESMRDWLWVPHFSHELIDQSGIQPSDVQGDLKAQIMQLLLLAAYHPERPWRTLVVELLGTLSSLPPVGGINYIRVFLRYILQTQDQKVVASFQEALRRHAPRAGDELMTYAQELEERGKIRAQVAIIENLLREGTEWPMIEKVTEVNEAQFQALKQQVEAMTE
jgi:predicted transposase/invertase (TIGR01784 family)